MSLLPEAAEKQKRNLALKQGLTYVGNDQYFDPFGATTIENAGARLVKSLAAKIAKSTDIIEVMKFLRGAKVAEKEIQKLAPRITSLTDPVRIESIIAKSVPAPAERGFIQTVRSSANTKPEVARSIEGIYDPLSNKQLLQEGRELITRDYDSAVRLAQTGKTALSNVVGQQLVMDMQAAGRLEDAISLVEKLAAKATTQGQAIQSLSLFNRLTPEGVLRFAQRELDRANVARPELNLRLKPEEGKAIIEQARKAQSIESGREKTIETARLIQMIRDLVPATLGQKVSLAQTMAQLLNPKTAIRNLVGNMGFATAENVSDVVGSGLDSALSLFTGRRSVAFPSFSKQVSGFKTGFRQGMEDALNRVETNYIPSQFEIPKTGVFKGRVGRSLETLLNVELRAPDRAFYQAAYDGSLYQQMKAARVKEPTDAMIERAHYEALYRTFQDDNLISQLFTRVKKALNVGQDFGVGDLVLKYPKTPANLLARGIEYSPAGILNVVYESLQPVIGRPFNQRSFVQAFSRALTGTTGLVGTGAFLHHVGIIAGKPSDDKDVRGLERTTGLGGYKINLSALKRFAMSGLDPNVAKPQKDDTLISYDWFQPQALPISIGANLDEGFTNPKATSQIESLISSFAEGVNTLAEQPLVQGLTSLKDQPDLISMATRILQGLPSSFVPTVVSQVNQLIDNTQRNSYSPSSTQYALNLAKNKIPGLAQTLPPTKSVFGQDLERYQGNGNNPFNVFFNPAFVSKYAPTPEAKLVLDLIGRTGDTTSAPRVVGYSQTINGQKKKLTPTQVTALQQYVGTATRSLFHQFALDPQFQRLSDEEKIKKLSDTLTDIGSAGRIVILGNRPKTVSKRVKDVINRSH